MGNQSVNGIEKKDKDTCVNHKDEECLLFFDYISRKEKAIYHFTHSVIEPMIKCGNFTLKAIRCLTQKTFPRHMEDHEPYRVGTTLIKRDIILFSPKGRANLFPQNCATKHNYSHWEALVSFLPYSGGISGLSSLR